MHHDASEATLNVCLGREGFTGGGLRFCGRLLYTPLLLCNPSSGVSN